MMFLCHFLDNVSSFSTGNSSHGIKYSNDGKPAIHEEYYDSIVKNMLENGTADLGFIFIATKIVIPILCILGMCGNLLNIIVITIRVSTYVATSQTICTLRSN